MRQIRLAQIQQTPRKDRCGRKPAISKAKAEEMKRWLLSSPSHRHIPYRNIPRLAPELELQGHSEVAIRTAFESVGYGRRVAKRKGFSDDPRHWEQRRLFAEEAITWPLERLRRQVFSDEVWAYGGAFTQSYVTCLVQGSEEDILRDRYAPGCVQHKYSKRPAWMFHGTICDGKKGPAVFWEKEWGNMNSTKYNEHILSNIEAWFQYAREHNVRLVWQQDGASCHRSWETDDNLYRRNIPSIEWPPYSPDLNLIEHVWSYMRRYIQEHYFTEYYDPKKIQQERLRSIVWEAWNAVPDDYIQNLFDSWYRRCQAVIDARGGPTKY
jgi:hypothetical protein